MRSVCYERVWPVEEFSANGEQCLNRLCQLRGQAHFDIRGLVRHFSIRLVSFMQYDLGYLDLEEKTLRTLENPFVPKLSPMS